MEFNVELMVKEVWYNGAWSCHAHFHPEPKFLDETLVPYMYTGNTSHRIRCIMHAQVDNVYCCTQS